MISPHTQDPGPPPATVREVYRILYDTYGPQGWWPAPSDLEMAVGAILVQNTRWENASRAIRNLKAAGALEVEILAEMPGTELGRLIRPSGHFNMKARKLKALAHHLLRLHGGRLNRLLAQPTDRARDELLTIWGIGPETADSILLYGGGHPVFVVDTYTGRIMKRLGLWDGRGGYQGLQALMTSSLTRDPRVFSEYHALLVRLAKVNCRRSDPICSSCPLSPVCLQPG